MTPMRLCGRIKLGTAGWLAAAIGLVALLERSVGLDHRWLWYDELHSANYSAHGPWAALISVLRFDVHPPLYYLQLSLWALPSRADLWLMMNTVAWSTAAVAVLIYCTMRVYGWQEGLCAGLLLAFAPAALAYSDQVRMYSLLTVLTVWAWYAQSVWTAESDGNKTKAGMLALIASQVAVVYTHSAGLVMLSGPVLFGFVRVIGSGRRDGIVRWFLAEVSVVALALPAIAIAMLRDVVHPRRPTFEDVIGTWTFLVTGNISGAPWAIVLGALCAVSIGVAAYYDKRLRLLVPTLVGAPLLVGLVVSYVVRPIWLDRIFITIVPFLCLVVALAITSIPKVPAAVNNGRRLAVLAFALIWAGVGFAQQLSREKGDGFKPAAALVRNLTHRGDLVLVEGHFPYWCFLWYYGGPDWGWPQHAFLLNPKWARVTERLPPRVLSWLDLSDSDGKIERNGVTVMLWDGSTLGATNAADVYVVRFAGGPPLTSLDLHLKEQLKEQQLTIEHWVR
jgi:hypothetical protein